MDYYWQSVTADGKPLFKLSAGFENDSLNLTVFQNESAWNIEVPRSELMLQSKNHNRSFMSYYEKLKQYLECCPKDVQFEFKNDEFCINLLLENKMKVLFFKTLLKKAKFSESMFHLLDALHLKKTQYLEELNSLKGQYSLVQTAYNDVHRKLDEFLDRRKVDELNLYNNFAAILNEKKRHIQHLNDLLVAFRQGRPTVNPPTQLKGKTNKRNIQKNKEQRVATPETSSESDYDTDDSATPNQSSENEHSSPVPSTSKIKEEYLDLSPDGALPCSVVFPKRMRGGNDLKMDIMNVAKESITQSEVKTERGREDSDSPEDEKPATVNFSTQDLLDDL